VTQQLLNKSFDNVEAVRRGLRDTAFESVGELGGRPVEVACLPLFRRVANRLEQVIRFRLASGPWRRLRLEGADGSELGTWDLADDGCITGADAYILEIDAPQAFRYAVLDEDGREAVEGRVTASPQRKWSVSLIHHSHLDVGYTDPQPLVVKNHLEYLDSALDLVNQTSSWDDNVRFRWNVEVNWPLERWLRVRGDRDRSRMVDAIKAGSIGVGALSLNLHSEACAIEELYEMVRFAVDFRREHGIILTSAMQTDVPGGVTSLVEVLADAGVRYLSVAHNYAGRSVPYLIGGEDLERPFYWKAPSGKRVLVWFTDTAHGNAYMEGNLLGLADSYDAAVTSLPYYLLALATRPYPFASGIWLPAGDDVKRRPYPHDFLHLRVQGKLGDNAPPRIAIAEIARQWNATWAYPHLKVDRNEDFLEEAEQRLGSAIPEWQGDWADWWADGLGSGARMLGWARHAQDAVRIGRTLYAVADIASGDPAGPVQALHDVYENIGLFDEHTWGARHPWGDDEEGWGSGALQWQHKASFAQRAREAADELLDSAARRAAGNLKRSAESTAAPGRERLAEVVVFNVGGWRRTDVVRVFVPFSLIQEGDDIVVCDGRDCKRLPTQTIAQEHVEHRPDGRFLVFLASEIPACGYATFHIVRGEPTTVETSDLDVATVQNDFYRASYSLRRACIDSIVNLETKRELVSADAPFGMNSYVFDRYGTSTRVDHLSGRVFAKDLQLVAERVVGEAAVLLRRSASELGETMTVDVRAPGCTKLTTSISAWRGVDRLDIENHMWKSRTVDKQSVFFAFPFRANEPDLMYELPGVATRAAAPCVPGSPRHMRAIRHWAALQEASGGIAWATGEAALVQFGDLHSPYAPFPGTLPLKRPEAGTVYSWVLNNIWDTNFPTEQGGEMRFRYAIASQAEGDIVGLGTRLGEAVASPLVAVAAPPRDGTPASGSFCSVERPEIRLLQATESAGGCDLVLWLNNCSHEEISSAVEFPDLAIESVQLATAFEDDRAPLAASGGAVSVRLLPGETRALMLKLSDGT
jgi:Glycosyl hydrolases family 38 N-terminal domain